MPTIKIKKTVGMRLDKDLQDILNTEPNKWNYFFEPHRIISILSKLKDQIERKNFFSEDYSIETFLDFLKAYIKATFRKEELQKIKNSSLKQFDDVFRSIQTTFIDYTSGLNNSTHVQIVNNYLVILNQLMQSDYREIFDRSEISLTSADIQAIGDMLSVNSESITEDLIQEYISLLKLSFDVPKLLAKYVVGLNMLPLAKACFLNKELDVHVVVTQFFHILGYQGQLLDYYQSSSKFDIKPSFLHSATQELKNQAFELQGYFFQHEHQHQDIKHELLQHYLLKHFFEIIFKKYPERIEILKTDSLAANYIKFDYVALPNSLICRNFPSYSIVRIEYGNLPAKVPDMACEAIRCSQKTSEQWKKSLKLLTLLNYKSHYTFRVADSYEKYGATSYAYGHSPMGGGFYIQGQLIKGTVYGEGYSFWRNEPNFIDVSRHEARHHDNYVLSAEARSVNPEVMSITVKSPNEGLAVNANGPCAPGYIDQDFSNQTAPSWSNLFEESFIGYFRSWLYTNYLIQRHPEFYQDNLTLNKTVFKVKWQLRLKNNEQDFINWLPQLKQACQSAPKELTLEDCPSPFLKNYWSPAEWKQPIITSTSLRTPRRITDKLRSRTTPIVKSHNQIPIHSNQPVFYDDYLHVMHLIYNNTILDDKVFKIKEVLTSTNYSSEIVNYQDPDRRLETSLHFALAHAISKGTDCSASIIKTLCSFDALLNLSDTQNQTAYTLAENCNNRLEIKTLFDKRIKKLQKNPIGIETRVSVYQYKSTQLIISIPISALANGIIGGIWNEVGQRYNQQYPYLPNIIHYGLKPISLAMDTAVMNSLILGSASSLASEDTWLSCAYYLGVNYLGLLFAQLGERVTQKIQNKTLNLLVTILLYTFLLNPSLLIELMNEGLSSGTFLNVVMPLLAMLSNGLLFKTGEYGAQKMIGKFFPENSAQNDSDRTYIGYQRGEINEDPNESFNWHKQLMDFKKSFTDLKKVFKPILKNSAHKLTFKSNLELLEEISSFETIEEINNNYTKFNKAFNALEKIRDNLSELDGIPNKNNILQKIINEVMPIMRAIRPFEQVIDKNGSNGNEKISVTFDQKQPMTLTPFFQRPHYTATPINKPKNEFPPPPTEQELQDMEESVYAVPKTGTPRPVL